MLYQQLPLALVCFYYERIEYVHLYGASKFLLAINQSYS